MKIKNFFKTKQNRISFIIFIVTMLIACSPLISKYCINGHDAEYHLLRIESLKEGILMGRPFLKVNALYFGGAGYASSMFYPDLLLYIPALLRCIGVSINASYHIFIAICICGCYLSAYYCAGKMTGSCYGGMLAGIILSLCQYHMDDIYIRAAAGEYTAFIFLPFVVYGLYNLLYEDMDKPWLIAVGYGGVLLCHTSSFVMCLVLGIGACIVKVKSFIKDKKLLFKLLLMAVITVFITLPYTLPMLEQMMNTTFKVSIPWNEPKFEAVSFAKVFFPVFPSLGLVTVIIYCVRILIDRSELDDKSKDLVNYADCLAIAGAVFAILATDLLPWDILGKYISFIQFPWRFFIMSSLLFAIADAIVLTVFVKNKTLASVNNTSAIVVVGVLIICAIAAVNELSTNTEGYYDYSSDYYSYAPYTANVIGGEWLPVTVEDKDALVEASEHMLTDAGSDVEFTRYKNELAANINSYCEYVDAPFVFYKGYKAVLTASDGNKYNLTIDGSGNNGLCRVYCNGNTGSLRVYYAGTGIQVISTVICIITILLLITVIVYKRKNKNRGSMADEK